MNNLNYNYQPIKYYLLTFVITFALWFIGAYMSFQESLNSYYMLVLLPGLFTPFLIALYFIFTSKNGLLKKDFINRLINLKLINLKYLPIIFLLMPIAVVVSILISFLFGQSLSQFEIAKEFSFSTGFVPVILLLIFAATFEELGWRGYGFESLEGRFNYLNASIIFSILWSLWHFPLIFVKDSYQFEVFNENFLFGLNFFVSIVPLGIIISWLCIKNQKSIPLAIFFHFIINISQEMFNITQVTKCIETIVLTFIVIGIVIYDKKLFFSKSAPLAVPTKK